jgi:Zn-finger nucleic acid-binding protein
MNQQNQEECPVCFWPMPMDPMWRYMGAKHVSLHGGGETQYRHDLCFNCCIQVIRIAQQKKEITKCPSCNQQVTLDTLRYLIEKTLYRFSVQDRSKLYSSLPKKYMLPQKNTVTQIQDLLLVIVDYCTLSDSKRPH